MHVWVWVWSVGSVQCCSCQPLCPAQASGEGDEAVSWSLYCSTCVMWMQILVPRWRHPKLKAVLGFRNSRVNTACFSPTMKITGTLVTTIQLGFGRVVVVLLFGGFFGLLLTTKGNLTERTVAGPWHVFWPQTSSCQMKIGVEGWCRVSPDF